jgi:hypothetical protein
MVSDVLQYSANEKSKDGFRMLRRYAEISDILWQRLQTDKNRRIHMNTRNSCYTYFKIVGDFNPDDVTELLRLTPEKSWKIGDLRRDGTPFDFALWEFGRCAEYDIEVDKQMHKTIAPLQDKIRLLNQFRETHDVDFVLEIVPTVYAGDITPCLAPSLDVMDFCHATRTELDIDLYVCDSTDT